MSGLGSDGPQRPPPPFPVSIVTGFLGAGKTTLLNRMLRDTALADTLVLINEYGSVGIDHHLVERVDGDMLVMTSGCLCCTIRGELVATLEDALRARDNGRMHFQLIIIETTGLADPAPVLHTVMTHPYLRLRFRLQAVVTLVDALQGEATLSRYREASRQVALADRLVVTKSDAGVEDDALAQLEGQLHALNPHAPVIDVNDPLLDANWLFNGHPFDPDALPIPARQWLTDAAAAEDAGKHRHGSHGHSHGSGHHEHGGIQSFCLRRPQPVTLAAVELFTELLHSAHGAKMLRLKGFVLLADDPERPLVIHGVQHIASPPQRLAAWPDADRSTRIVFILDGLAPAFVRDLWNAAVGETGVDQADHSALTQNPLASIRGGLFTL